MKKITYCLLICLIVSGFISCKKDLTLAPTDFVAPEYFYTTEDQLNQALTGIYSILQAPALYGITGNTLYSQWLLGCDDAFNNTSTTGIPQKYDYNSSFSGVADIWNALYRGIDRANNLIANIDKPVMNETNRKVILGETKFLRAYYYFMLVSNFGGVPLKTTPTTSVKDLNVERNPANEVYDFVLKEMEAAEQMVLPITAYTHSGRINQSAVQGMLARVNLLKAGEPNNDVARYADALKWAKKVISSGIHQLNPDYAQVFINYIQDKYDIKENLWEVEFYSTGVGDFFTRYGGWGASNGIRQMDVNLGYSNGPWQVHNRLFKLFDPQDTRRDWSIASYGYLNDNGPIKLYWRDDQIYDRRVGKWRREYELQPKKITNFTSTNYGVLRYSDILLMAAEAENYLNGPSAAYQFVNQVRKRGYAKDINGETLKSITIINGGSGYTTAPTVTISGGGATTQATAVATVAGGTVTNIAIINRGNFYTSQPTISFAGTGTGASATASISVADDYLLKPEQYASKTALFKTIQDERARELAFEGHRRYDLIRWGILIPTVIDLSQEILANAPAAYKALAVAGQNITQRDIYIPIPLRELTLNSKLVQTEGWK